MIKIKVLLFHYLPNEAHHRFFEKATRELAAAGSGVKSVVEPLDIELNKWFTMETADLAWMRKSELTAAIADADYRLDNALTGLSAQVESARHSPQPDVALAAEHLYLMFKKYGRVVSKPYPQEIEAVSAILAHLNGDHAADAQTVGVAVWIAELTSARADFVSLFEQREAQTLEKPASGFRETRREIENVWHQIVNKVNAGSELNFSNDFEKFINTLNPEIDYLNNAYHRVRFDIALCEPAPIKPQTYTGYPCTPTTEVLRVTKNGTIKLELGKDYNFTFKNNIEVGNAECTIHGKGAYRGHKTVTFIITR
jgi:hypothetical protein